MAANYIELIGDYYSDYDVYTDGDPSDYSSIQWADGDTPISQAELDVVHLTNVKTLKALALSEEAHLEIVQGFESSALGTPHFYDAQHDDQLNLVGSVSTGADMPYACRRSQQASQVIDYGGAKVGTDPTGLSIGVSYSATVNVNGANHNVYIQGDTSTTFDDLVSQIQNDINGYGQCSLENGNIVIKSDTVGSTSTVEVTDSNLFNSVTGYIGINSANGGVDAVNGPKAYMFHTNANLIQVINDGKDVKLFILQKFNTKYIQILMCATEAEVEAIVWND